MSNTLIGQTTGEPYSFAAGSAPVKGATAFAQGAPTAPQNPTVRKHNNVIVNLFANVDAQGDLDLVASDVKSVKNIVVCLTDLPVNALFTDMSDGIIEFWEDPAQPDVLDACVSDPSLANGLGKDGVTAPIFSGFDTARRDNISAGLNAIVNGQGSLGGPQGTAGLEAIAAPPFNTGKYASVAQYHLMPTFGALGLASYSHQLYNHVAATAAIDNDVELVNYFNSNIAGNAQIGFGLAEALRATSATLCADIVKQVLSQDQSRSGGQDNTDAAPQGHQALMFAEGDIVYVTVNLKAPTVTVAKSGPPAAAVGPPDGSLLPSDVANLTGSDSMVDISYTLQITLSAPVADFDRV